MRADHSAVVVLVPEAEPVVGQFRRELDPAAGLGVPGHITVIAPFVPPARIDEGVLAALAEAVGSVPAFDVALTRTAWFGNSVLWLSPEPSAPLRTLTAAVWDRFPDCPPYRGAYADVVPHLTVGMDQPVEMLRAAAAAIAPRLPIRTRVAAVTLLACRCPTPGV